MVWKKNKAKHLCVCDYNDFYIHRKLYRGTDIEDNEEKIHLFCELLMTHKKLLAYKKKSGIVFLAPK